LAALDHDKAYLIFKMGKAGGDERPGNFLSVAAPPLGQGLSKVWFEQMAFPRLCRQERVDVAHVPYFAPPLFPSVATVVTIHDLIPLLLPAYRGSIWVRLYTSLVARATKRAAAIITDSESSKRDIVRLLSLSKVQVIPLAVPEGFRRVSDEGELERVRQKYHLPSHFILYLGGFDQRKNLPTLFEAFREVKGLGYPLVVAGQLPVRDTAFFPDHHRLAGEAGVEEAVRFIGWVPEEEKPALYTLATLFLYPSLYEGFGLPPLEAMACGTPIIASKAASLPEVVGEGGILVPPTDVAAWAQAMREILLDEGRRQELGERGLEQAAKFSWQKTAEETLAVYEEVAKKGE
jgi:glycosyltransferase involved in cell wall biosynthesis